MFIKNLNSIYNLIPKFSILFKMADTWKTKGFVQDVGFMNFFHREWRQNFVTPCIYVITISINKWLLRFPQIYQSYLPSDVCNTTKDRFQISGHNMRHFFHVVMSLKCFCLINTKRNGRSTKIVVFWNYHLQREMGAAMRVHVS